MPDMLEHDMDNWRSSYQPALRKRQAVLSVCCSNLQKMQIHRAFQYSIAGFKGSYWKWGLGAWVFPHQIRLDRKHIAKKIEWTCLTFVPGP